MFEHPHVSSKLADSSGVFSWTMLVVLVAELGDAQLQGPRLPGVGSAGATADWGVSCTRTRGLGTGPMCHNTT